MTKRFILLFGFSFLVLLCIHVSAQTNPWPEVRKEAKPWGRWWWMGNAVDKENLGSLLHKYQDAGFGGVEIAPIYGAKGYEDKYITYLSPKWMEMLQYTVKQAGDLGMGVDLTTGTGWPFGGPQIGKEQAATKAVLKSFKIEGGHNSIIKIFPDDPKQQAAALQSLTAYNENGQAILLTDKVSEDGTLHWKPNKGKWELFAVFAGKTGQLVKRAAPGGEGFTLNHFSRKAVDHYLDRFDHAFEDKSPGVRAFYNDSYEVYGADWSEGFFDEFLKRRGYDLRLHIRDFLSDNASEELARLKSDYRQTMAEMLLDNFTQPWTEWAHGYKSISKNQAHGSPGNLLDLYAAVDIPEVETFGSSYFPIPDLRRDSADIRNVDPDPIMLKFASSAANVTGKKLVSSETFTWLTEHFKTSLSQCKPEVEQCFLSGVNHVFYHGITYSPQEAGWPGWLFYASTNFVPTNSFWPHLSGLNNYITRVQSVLQAGKSDNELLLYWPVFDDWDDPKGRLMTFTVHDVDKWLQPTDFYKNVKVLQEVGYTFDFISDNLLKNAAVSDGLINTSPNNTPYKTIIVPITRKMPLETLEKVLALAKDGATVVMQKLPEDVPGLGDYGNRHKQFKKIISDIRFTETQNGIQYANVGKGRVLLSLDIKKALQYSKINGEEKLSKTGLGFIRRHANDGGTYYYVVNHTAKDINEIVPFQSVGREVILLDPQDGRYGKASSTANDGGSKVRLQLKSGEAVILKFADHTADNIAYWKYLEEPKEEIQLSGKWLLTFKEGGPTLPESRELKSLIPWTEEADNTYQLFSGTGVYSTTFNMPEINGEYILNLGKVYESARVWINGKDAGISWSLPHRLRIGEFVKPGKNTIEIEVTNLMANRIRDLDKRGVEWRRYHEINFVNIDYKDFDASNWEVQPSGLKGPVTIINYQSN